MMEEINEDDEHGSKERVIQKYFLLEWKLVKPLIDDIVSNGRVSDYSSVYKIRSIVAKYQEQAQLLEPYLESMVSSLMSVFESIAVENGEKYDRVFELIMPLCIIIYSLITACGYKAVVKFFPHHVSYLELAVCLMDRFHGTKVLSSSCEESTGEMETKCVIILWLSMLVLVPFDLSSVDSSLVNTDGFVEDDPPPIVLTILKISKDYLSSAGPMRSMACILLSKLLTRPDMPKALASFISWTHGILFLTTYDLMDNFRLLGSIEALAAIFKVHVGSHGFLMDMVPTIWTSISRLVLSNTAIQSPLLRKYLMKLSQRIGLCFVPYRSPSWHYVNASSSLVKKVSTETCDETDQVDVATREEVPSFMHDGPVDVPEIVEAIIDILLSALKDKDTVVRWSAAKGIGRITSRLTSNFAEEVQHAILELFSPHEGEGSWHGGCLALAELARRGLLLPASLPIVVPVIVKALHYDIRKGPHSVGSHVRDAASYVCWAFGRAYCYTDMKSVLNELAPHLLTVACYDREVNCRRAAAAAFQENVGRQRSYPHGIDIVNYADYFSLASRVNSYLYVAGCIAQYDGYLLPFVDELLHNKIIHWDKCLRELAAEALSMLVKFDKDYFANTVLEELLPSILSSDLCSRHGAILATGQLVLTLYQQGYAISTEQHKSLASVVPALEKKHLYSGKGGEIMRAAVSRFVECMSLAHLTLPENLKQCILDTINENLKHPNLKIQNAAVDALKHFSRIYLIFSDSGQDDLVFKYLVLLDDPIFSARRGSAMAIGVLPCEILTKNWKDVILKLCMSCAVEDNPNIRDVESRVNAVKGLVSVCETLTKGEAEGHICISDDAALHLLIKTDVIKALLKALEDYSVDKRGDVGSWIREAAINGLETCALLLSRKDMQSFHFKLVEERSDLLFSPEFALSLVGGLIKQAVEKMDKLRKAAANSIQRVLYNKTCFIPFIPFREKLEEIVPNSEDLKWEDPIFSFPRFIQLLQIGCYSRYVLSGLVVSVGGLQDSLRKVSFSALEGYLNANDTDDESLIKVRESMLCRDILWILLEYKMCDRVIVPTLKMIEILLAKKRLHFPEKGEDGDEFVTGILASIKREVKRSKDFRKLNTSITILEYLSYPSHPMNTNSFTLLLSFLGHPYPKIRRVCGEQVYLALLHNPTQVADDELETALDLVAETEWDGNLRMTMCDIVQLCQLTAVDTAALLRFGGAAAAKAVTVDDENKSYSSLVGSAGY